MGDRRHGPLPPIIAAGVCAVALVALFCVAYFLPAAQRLDATALHGFNTLESGILRRPAWMVAFFGGYLPFGPGLAALWVAALKWKRKREAVAATVMMVAAGATAEVLKVVLAHPRFQPVLGPHQVNAASFPSGSVTSAMSMTVAALLVAPGRWRALSASFGAVFVLVVSLGVMISAWHFPSDVLGGILVATGYGFVAVAVLRRLDGFPGRRRLQARVPRPASFLGAEAAGVATALALLGIGLLGILVDRDPVAYVDTYTTTVAVGLVMPPTSGS
jgi:membrane-associated phospholipid phosphatase